MLVPWNVKLVTIFIRCFILLPKLIQLTHSWHIEELMFATSFFIVARILKHLLSGTFYKTLIDGNINYSAE